MSDKGRRGWERVGMGRTGKREGLEGGGVGRNGVGKSDAGRPTSF